MRIIQPCCATKQLMMLRDALGSSGTTQFKGYGDLSLTELLPALLTRYAETEMIIVAPAIPDHAAEIIGKWMRRQMARMDGKGKLDYLRKLTVIADLSEDKSPKASAWLKDNPFEGRLILIDKAQTDTVLLLPDIAITGPLNMRYGREFVCTVTTVKEKVQELWKQYPKQARTYHRYSRRAKAVAEPAQEQTIEPAQEQTVEPAQEQTAEVAPEPETTPAVVVSPEETSED